MAVDNYRAYSNPTGFFASFQRCNHDNTAKRITMQHKTFSPSILASSVVALGLTIGITACGTSPTGSTSAAPAPSAAKADEKKSTSGGIASGIGSLAGAIGSSPSGSGAGSSDNKLGAAVDLFKAASVTDDEVKSSALQFRAYEDKRSKIAPAGNKYGARLARLTKKHVNEDGLKLNFKAVLNPSVNANATADGSVRIYSGLMDMMTDAELLGVIGHEIGHVKLGHRLSKTRAALLASASRKAAASSSGAVGMIADSELGGFGEQLFNGQFSQSAETESDDYGLAFMKKHKYDVKAMESAFRKLAKGGGKGDAVAQMLSSHPDSDKRADRMRDKVATGK